MKPVHTQTAIPCTLMRGGSSKGPFFLASDLPSDPALRDRVLLAAMGSPDPRQIDGVGGADPLTSKAGIVSQPPSGPASTSTTCSRRCVVDKALIVDGAELRQHPRRRRRRSPSSRGWCAARDRRDARGDLHGQHANQTVVATVQTPGGRATYEGDARDRRRAGHRRRRSRIDFRRRGGLDVRGAAADGPRAST